MAKRKNYLKMYVDYCRKNGIWFAVCGNGDIDQLTDTESMCDLYAKPVRLGSKEAYDELLAEVKSARTPNSDNS